MAGQLVQLVSYGVIVAPLVVLMVLERHQRRGRAAFPILLAASTVVYAGWYTLAPSNASLGFARWFRDLPIT